MKKIKLTQGKVALVDNEDFEEISKYKWYFDHGYARTSIGGRKNKKNIYLHRMIMKCPEDRLIDHKNRNTLDCRRSNMRICNKSKNAVNSFLRKDNTSGFKGITWHERENKWKARVTVNQKRINLGTFITKEEAALAYNQAAQKYFGEFARLNTI